MISFNLLSFAFPLSFFHAFIGLAFLTVLFSLIRKKRSKDTGDVPIVPYRLPWFGSALDIARYGLKVWLKNKSLQYGPVFRAYISGTAYLFVIDPIASRQVLNMKDTDVSLYAQEFVFKNAMMMRHKDVDNYLSAGDKVNHLLIENHFKTNALSDILYQAQRDMRQMLPPNQNGTKCGIYDFVGKIIYRIVVSELVDIPELLTDRSFEYFNALIVRVNALTFTHVYRQKYVEPRAYHAREFLVSIIKKHLCDHVEESTTKGEIGRGGDAFLKGKGVSIDGRARLMLANLWVALFNILPTAFWLVHHILEDPVAKQAVVEEIRKIGQNRKEKSSNNNTIFTHDDLNEMYMLESMLLETFRFDTTREIFRLRRAVGHLDLQLSMADGKKVQVSVDRGSKIITCPPLSNRDDEVFQSADKFVWNRFAPTCAGPVEFRKNDKILPNPIDIFGSGPHYCPGRNFARGLLKALIANLLLQYDICFSENGDKKIPGLYKSVAISMFKTTAPDTDVEIELYSVQ